MGQLARIVDVEHLGEHRLRLTFSDALVRELDFSEAVRDWGGVLEALRDPAFFGQVGVDPLAGTISWPNGVDFDPDVLHGDHAAASGRAATVLKQYRLGPTT
jgi:hypothetical protein